MFNKFNVLKFMLVRNLEQYFHIPNITQ